MNSRIDAEVASLQVFYAAHRFFFFSLSQFIKKMIVRLVAGVAAVTRFIRSTKLGLLYAGPG